MILSGPERYASTGGKTWIEPEERAYSARGAMLRKGRAIWPDGKIRVVYAGIPDTFFSIPAHGKAKGGYFSGYVTSADGEYVFRIYDRDKARFDALIGVKP